MAVSDALATSILARDSHRCVYCGRAKADGYALSVDHVTPKVWFLDPGFAAPVAMDSPANLVAACTFCNSLKRDMDLSVYAHYLRNRYGMNTRPMVDRVRRQLRKPT